MKKITGYIIEYTETFTHFTVTTYHSGFLTDGRWIVETTVYSPDNAFRLNTKKLAKAAMIKANNKRAGRIISLDVTT